LFHRQFDVFIVRSSACTQMETRQFTNFTTEFAQTVHLKTTVILMSSA